MTIKTNDKKRVLLFGDFVAAAYQSLGGHGAQTLVRMAVNERMIVFSDGQRVVISEE